MLDSLVRVSRRAARSHYASILETASLGPSGPHCTLGYNTPKGHIPKAFIRPPKPMLALPRESEPADGRSNNREGV